MQKSINVYIGWDGRDLDAFNKCSKSILRTSTIEPRIHPLRDIDMRKQGLYWRSYHVDRMGQKWDDRDGTPFSTDFTYLRYLAPLIYGEPDQWFLFCDPDMMFRDDLAKLIELADPNKAVMVVKHKHTPHEGMKMGGVIQTSYERKNWTSFMLFNKLMIEHLSLSPYEINMQTREHLHQMCWVQDKLIGELPERWNWLNGYSPVDMDPAVVHFTRGTPGMVDNGYKMMYSQEWMDL